ncbi:MAG: UDP-N-acetylmuramate dehydrogenase [Bacteroidota bacterium]|nr:UDP-N-acetylmuramate dehydrogenase [Bacteroidota bacterium]
MIVQQNVSIKHLNTFGIDFKVDNYIVVDSMQVVKELSEEKKLIKHKIQVGGGSNILCIEEQLHATLIHNQLKGKKIIKETAEHVWVEIMAGEKWHDFVVYAIENNWGGVENLSLIPGTVGAAPIQNIGAYGVEVSNCIAEVHAWNWNDKESIKFNKEECKFGYRTSIFKEKWKQKILITSVVFKLDKHHHFNTTYGAITQELDKMGITTLSIKAISDAVIAIRKSKLPNPEVLGNAGSFFKNPTIKLAHFKELQKLHTLIPSFAVDAQHVKVPAGWLIEQCGWKGKKVGACGVHKDQALVLVNYGKASGSDLFNLSEAIIQDVQEKFNIELEREVQILRNTLL